MLPYVINRYNDSIHSSTGYKPKDAIHDKYASESKVKLEINARTKRRYPNISIDGNVNVFKTACKYCESKETKSRWSDQDVQS